MMVEPASVRSGRFSAYSSDGTPWLAVLTLVLLPCIFNAIALFPEAQHVTPSDNDSVFHYLMIERADQAISAGDNPFDHWMPELELGFPQFFYYQNLPHLMVVGLYRLLLKQVSLIRLFNLVRYLLLITFPLTVYWSMRRMEFSAVAAATGAAVSSMLSCRLDYGFDYNSYLWVGFGMFPQLCAMHLMFAGTACVRRAIVSGQGFTAAILTSSALVLSDLLYGYIFAIVIGLLCLLSIPRCLRLDRGLRKSVLAMIGLPARLAVIAVVAAVITAYQTVPFLRQAQYLNRTFPPTIEGHRIAMTAPDWLAQQLGRVTYLRLLAFPFTAKQLMIVFDGNFFDNNRLPIVTSLIAIGIAYAVVMRSEGAMFALTVLSTWMILLIPGSLHWMILKHLPLVKLLPVFRFVSGVDFGAIFLAGLGGEFIWKCCRCCPPTIRGAISIIVVVGLFSPMLVERWNFYRPAADAMDATDEALKGDQDLVDIISGLKKLPPGRVYAGTRGNWGRWMNVGAIHVYDLLPTEQFATVMPWQTLSLNAPLLWKLNIPSLPICRLYNIRYVIAPPALKVPDSYRAVLTTQRYVLYEVDTGGYMQLGTLARIEHVSSSDELYESSGNWLKSDDFAAGRFVAYLVSDERSQFTGVRLLNLTAAGKTPDEIGSSTDEVVTPDALSAEVTTNSSAILAIKITYHPNWHVTIDGREQPTFMVSPSLLGTIITPGRHEVRAEYRSNALKKELLLLSCLVLIATLVVGGFGFGRFGELGTSARFH
jgi:hypothetical protein